MLLAIINHHLLFLDLASFEQFTSHQRST